MSEQEVDRVVITCFSAHPHSTSDCSLPASALGTPPSLWLRPLCGWWFVCYKHRAGGSGGGGAWKADERTDDMEEWVGNWRSCSKLSSGEPCVWPRSPVLHLSINIATPFRPMPALPDLHPLPPRRSSQLPHTKPTEALETLRKLMPEPRSRSLRDGALPNPPPRLSSCHSSSPGCILPTEMLAPSPSVSAMRRQRRLRTQQRVGT